MSVQGLLQRTFTIGCITCFAPLMAVAQISHADDITATQSTLIQNHSHSAASNSSWMVDLLLAVANGLVTAGALALIGLWYATLRDKELKNDVWQTLSKITVTSGGRGSGVIIRNNTHAPITIRSVELLAIATAGHPVRNPGRVVMQYRLDYEGPAEFIPQPRQKEPESDERDYVTLAPYTAGKWLSALHNAKLYPYTQLHAVEVVAEYMSVLKRPKVVRARTPEPGLLKFVIPKADSQN